MDVYFTKSQLPELRELPREARRDVVWRGLGILRLRAPMFYWLPTLFCWIGGLSGSLLGAALLGHFRQDVPVICGSWALTSMAWALSGAGIVGCMGGFVGLQLQRWKLRPLLRSIVEKYISEILHAS